VLPSRTVFSAPSIPYGSLWLFNIAMENGPSIDNGYKKKENGPFIDDL